MENYTSPPRRGRKFLASWAGSALLGALLAFGGGAAQAAMPPAGTQIGNQALATFIDSSNVRQETKSNNVLTQVLQVGAFTLTADNTKSASVGSTVYMPHILTNTGNGADKFTLSAIDGGSSAPTMTVISIYQDSNGTGTGSGTLLCGPGGASCSTGVTVEVAAGSAYNFVVAYQVPSTAGTGWTGKGTVTAKPPAGSTIYTTASLSNTDIINLTNGAAFSVNKSLTLPAVKAPGGVDWPAAISTAAPSPAGSICNTSWPITSGSGCNYTVYTISYTNTGAATGSFAFRDVIPDGMTFVSKSAVWSGNGGVALAEPSTAPAQPVNFTVTGKTLAFSAPSVPANASGSVSFVVLVNSTALPDGSNTGNIALYGTSDCKFVDISTCATTPTNKPPFTTKQIYVPVASSLIPWTTPDTSSPLPLPSDTSTNNLVIQPTVAQNGWVRFDNYVTNAGNGVDTFNVVMNASNFPAGTQFSFFKEDGLTPLLDTNNDQIVDTGPLSPNSSIKIVVKAVLPRNAPVGSGPYSVRFDAISTAAAGTESANKTDSVWDQVTTITTMALVDLTNTAAGSNDSNNGDLGIGPSAAPTTNKDTTPGNPASFTLFIKNNDSASGLFRLSASQTQNFPGGLPAGWSVKFYPSGTTCAATGITEVSQPISVGANAQVDVVACAVPPNTPVKANVLQALYFQVISTTQASNGAIISDIKYDQVTVTPANKMQLLLVSDQTGQVSPGGSVSYQHQLTNGSTGNMGQTCGPFTVTAVSDQPTSGFNYAVTWGGADGSDNTYSSTNLLPAMAQNATVKLRVKVIAPNNAIDKWIDNVKLTVTDAGNPSCGVVFNTDSTTVIASNQMSLLKEIAQDASCNGQPGAFSTEKQTAKPGACVIYRITATNNGTSPVTKVWLADMVPAFTTYTAAQPANQCVATNATSGTVSFVHTAGSTGVSCGSDNIVLPGSGSGSVQMMFGVQLNSN